MVYTVTISPCLDYTVWVDELRLGDTNRTARERLSAGGKGLNVSVVLHRFGIPTVALGFVGGFTGDAIEEALRAEGVESNLVRTAGISRINVKLKASEETEVNGRGVSISEADLQKLYRELDGIPDGSYLVLAGTVPHPLPDTLYGDIMARFVGRDVRIVVDATERLLENALPYRPFLVKPNHRELGALFGAEPSEIDEIEFYARKLRDSGARNVIVSMAGDGALMIPEHGEPLNAKPPKGEVVDSVGAGDSMVAGFLAGWIETGDVRRAFLNGIAAGSASAFKEGLTTAEETKRLLTELLGR